MSHANSSWLARRIEAAVKTALSGAYKSIKVDSGKYLQHLRRAYGLPIESFGEMHALAISVVEHIADRTIAASTKVALAEGAGLGVGGILTVVPDVGFLTTISVRMIQKLSLIYGFEYSTEDEIAELWIAAASAAGVDIGKELLEREVIERFVPRVIERIAVRAGAEVAEKWAARLVPLVSSAAWLSRAAAAISARIASGLRETRRARVQRGRTAGSCLSGSKSKRASQPRDDL